MNEDQMGTSTRASRREAEKVFRELVPAAYGRPKRRRRSRFMKGISRFAAEGFARNLFRFVAGGAAGVVFVLLGKLASVTIFDLHLVPPHRDLYPSSPPYGPARAFITPFEGASRVGDVIPRERRQDEIECIKDGVSYVCRVRVITRTSHVFENNVMREGATLSGSLPMMVTGSTP